MAGEGRFDGPLRGAVETALAGSARIAPDLLADPESALPCPPAADRAAWDAETGWADRATLADQCHRAALDLGAPWPLPLASTAARVHRDGDRDTHEQLVFTRQRRLSRAAVAAAATGEARFLDQVADGVLQLCEQSSWCWPAHDDTFAAQGWVLPRVDRPYLDLGSGEVAAQLAWIDHLLGAALDERYPGLRPRIRYEATVRVFDPFTARRDWHWLGLDGNVHNWNPWIHSNLLVAALRLLDRPAEAETRAGIVDLVVEGLDRYVAALPADGAIDEGYAYWWNGAGRAIEALDVLAHATGGRLDLVAGVAALRATVGFPHRVQLSQGWALNFSDAPARASHDVPWDALHRAALRVGDPEAAAFATSHRRPGTPVAHEDAGLGRLLRAITDRAWAAASPTAAPLPAQVWLESTQVRLVREQAGDPSGLALAVKGGHNGEHHNHNDVGEVIVATDGVPVVVDAGRPTYTAATFGPDRYSAWPMQSAWHNLPQVRETPQSTGAGHRAVDVVPLADGLALDLAPAYPVPGLLAWRRTASLTDAQVAVRDEWTLEPWSGAGEEPATTVHYLLAGDVAVSPGLAEVAPLDGATAVRLEWPAEIAATVTARRLDDPMLSAVWGDQLTRLELDVTGRSEVTVTVAQIGKEPA